MSSSSSSSSSSSAPAPHEAVEDSEPYTFVDKSSADDLICIICRELATDAVGCSTQQHLMCKKCAIQIVTERQPCPFKCNKRAVLVTVCMGDFVRRLKNKLRVECNDCKKQMELGNFRSHSCPVARQSCAVPGCNYVGHAKSMAHHDVAEAVKHSGLYRAAFGHLRQMIEGMTTLEQKASGKRKASDVGKEEANKKAKKPMLKKPIDFYLEHKEANESIDVDMDDDEEEKSSLAKKRQWREDFCKLSDSDKQPFVVSAIRMRTTLRAEMYTTLGFRNASVDRVEEMNTAKGWLGTTVGVAHQLFFDAVGELVGLKRD